MIGKLDPERLKTIFGRTGAPNPALLTGAAYGEDAAAIDLGDGETLVVSSDPISLAAEAAGTLGVHVACNDIAVAGADPEFLTNVLFLPDDDPALLSTLTDQLDAAAGEIGVTIVGGHSEYVPVLSRPLLSLTAFGRTDRYVPTGGAEPGDRVLLTKGAAIEATGIIATDFADDLHAEGVDEPTIERAAAFFEEISVLDDARAVREVATAMHDPTEGGVFAGLVELAGAADVDVIVDREAVPIRPETETVCSALGVDPLRVFGSGALLATVPPEAVETARSRLAEAGIDVAEIGSVEPPAEDGERPGALVLDGERIVDAGTDQLYPFWE
ncbi:MAG: AIR synthase family protein [Halohasta sp.]